MRASYLVPVAAVVLTACADTSPTSPTTPAAPASAVAIAIESGNGQEGKAGEPLASAFVVRVTDASGLGVKNISVNFTVSAGHGAVISATGDFPGASVVTDGKGLAQVTFKPNVLGPSSVTASVVASQLPAVTFSSSATALVIERWGPLWDIGFVAPPCSCSDVVVPVGTPIEWKSHGSSSTPDMTYSVASVAAPESGVQFDSGILRPNERFRFVPTVTGTWRYEDRLTGHTGTLTAR